MECTMIHDIVEENGKTIKENNLAISHDIPIDTLVEIKSESECVSEYWGIRAYVAGLSRDCDGTPLYVLGFKKGEHYPEKDDNDDKETKYVKFLSKFSFTGGWSKDSLIVIKLP